MKMPIGSRVGRLTILAYTEDKNYKYCYLVVCDCGTMKKIRSHKVYANRTLSCGCLKHSKTIDGMCGDGMKKHPLYHTWKGIIYRCCKPSSSHYAHYGGRGITVAKEFLSAAIFIGYVIENLGNKPTPKHEIDRVNNEKGYEPGNLRWATRIQNANNRRNTVMMEHDGNWMSVADVARLTGINYRTLYQRQKRIKEKRIEHK